MKYSFIKKVLLSVLIVFALFGRNINCKAQVVDPFNAVIAALTEIRNLTALPLETAQSTFEIADVKANLELIETVVQEIQAASVLVKSFKDITYCYTIIKRHVEYFSDLCTYYEEQGAWYECMNAPLFVAVYVTSVYKAAEEAGLRYEQFVKQQTNIENMVGISGAKKNSMNAVEIIKLADDIIMRLTAAINSAFYKCEAHMRRMYRAVHSIETIVNYDQYKSVVYY